MSVGARINNAELEQNLAEQELINATKAEIKTWAIAAVKRFAQPYNNAGSPVWQFNDFWKRSNTFHAYLRFVQVAEGKWGATDPELKEMQALRATMITANSAFFDSQIGGDGVWADDYGWCGISCLEARNFLLRIGDQNRANEYLKRAIRCWNTMCSVGYDSAATAKPVPHGCSNISAQAKKDGENGTKNSVTNSNLLVLSLRLYNALKTTDKPAATQYLKMAYAQFVWFTTWFRDQYVSLDEGYYLRLIAGPNGPAQDGLLHERPRAEPDYNITDRPKWERGWIWSGDQGLILGALAELYLVRADLLPWIPDPPTFDSELRSAFFSVARGVTRLLFGGVDTVLREAPFHSCFDHAYGVDYVGGRGILLRYVSEPAVSQMMGNRWFYPAGFAATATAVWNSRDASDQFAALWNKNNDSAFNQRFRQQWGTGDIDITNWDLDSSQIVDGVLQAAGLDAFTAAVVSLVGE